MAAKGKRPPVKPRRTIAELEAELERRTAEQDEALARESAMADVLGVINSSAGDLAPIFDAILEKAHSLSGAALGALAIFDGEQFRVVAAHGTAEFTGYTIRPRLGGGVCDFTRGEGAPMIGTMVLVLQLSACKTTTAAAEICERT
jgi:hypothetical protein